MRVIILLIMLLFIIGCTQIEPAINLDPIKEITPEPEEVPEVIEVEPEEVPEVIEEEPTCEEWAETLFPFQWVFKQEVTQDPKFTREVISLYKNKWMDGSVMGGTSLTKIKLGEDTGENVNYYYTKMIFPGMKEDNYGFTYNEKIIDLRGNVLGTNNFEVRPVFKVINEAVANEQDASNNTIKMKYYTMVTMDSGFVSCEKVS